MTDTVTLPTLYQLRIAVLRYAQAYVDRHDDPTKAGDQRVADAEQEWTDMTAALYAAATAEAVSQPATRDAKSITFEDVLRLRGAIQFAKDMSGGQANTRGLQELLEKLDRIRCATPTLRAPEVTDTERLDAMEDAGQEDVWLVPAGGGRWAVRSVTAFEELHPGTYPSFRAGIDAIRGTVTTPKPTPTGQRPSVPHDHDDGSEAGESEELIERAHEAAQEYAGELYRTERIDND